MIVVFLSFKFVLLKSAVCLINGLPGALVHIAGQFI